MITPMYIDAGYGNYIIMCIIATAIGISVVVGGIWVSIKKFIKGILKR